MKAITYVVVGLFACQRCGHRWMGKEPIAKHPREVTIDDIVPPTCCPACHSPYWKTPSKRPFIDDKPNDINMHDNIALECYHDIVMNDIERRKEKKEKEEEERSKEEEVKELKRKEESATYHAPQREKALADGADGDGLRPVSPCQTEKPRVIWSTDGFQIESALIELWRRAYPACDIELEMARAHAWLLANPAKRPRRSYQRFLVNWLARVQDRGGSRIGGTVRRPANGETVL
jgi:hypothetical protein